MTLVRKNQAGFILFDFFSYLLLIQYLSVTIRNIIILLKKKGKYHERKGAKDT